MKAVLLGLFDGVHTGHRLALEALKRSGAETKTVYTFSSVQLDTKGARKLILTDDEKRSMLLAAGADEVVFADFAGIREYSPEEFVLRVLKDELRADTIICGENFRFGKNAAGDAALLKELLGRENIQSVIVPILNIGGEPVSTTRIRALIEAGRIKEANSLLGYGYFISGRVIHGDARGRRMGIRTINISFDEAKLTPFDGVYSSDVVIGGKKYMGVTDIGFKPTVKDTAERGIETHILDFDGDVYNNTVSISFNDYYRKEIRFSSRSELIDAINQDIKRRKEEGLHSSEDSSALF